jgi:hypothetical protein
LDFLCTTSRLEDRVLLSAVDSSIVPRPAAEIALHTRGHNVGAAGARMATHATSHHDHHAHQPTAARWSWLANTYWYVPTNNLSAVISTGDGQVVPVLDQTVFQITHYRDGYFWGNATAQYGANSAGPSTSFMIGSVTPQGRVLLSFTANTSSGTTVTSGFGVMQRKFGQWTMENQMFTPGGTIQIGHWAYMVQTHPGLPSWNSLPGVGVSVPEFLSEAAS